MGNINLRKIEDAEGAPDRTRHGVRAYLMSGKLPSGRAWKRCQAEISALREALIKQYGGADAIRPDVEALIESAIEALTIQRLASLYVKKVGILRRDSLKEGNLELHSILSGQFATYCNLTRLNLEAAARLAGQKGPEPIQTIAEIIAEVDAEKGRAAENGPGRPQDGRTPEGQAEDTRES